MESTLIATSNGLFIVDGSRISITVLVLGMKLRLEFIMDWYVGSMDLFRAENVLILRFFVKD